MAPEIVFALYRPQEGKGSEFEQLLSGHHTTLQKLELATDRPAVIARAKDGTYIEVYEWRSRESSKLAHEHPEVARIWESMGRIAEFATLGSLSEAGTPFPHFDPVNVAM